MSEFRPEIIERIKLLEEKYAVMGQDLVSYLDGLLYSDYLTYWDYINLDVLLSLQQPKTNIPDEKIFIIYHQITELYFKLIVSEMDQLAEDAALSIETFLKRVERINRYFMNLTKSFEVMMDGMDPKQFLKFRMALLPASGFQSAQYRSIEIRATAFINLVDKEHRNKYDTNSSISDMFEFIYWKAGATELATGKKTLTLRQFEEKYTGELIKLANQWKHCNLWTLYKKLDATDQGNLSLINALKFFDVNVNINWPLVHYKTAARYLERKPEDIAATGGTNWQKYLPPRFQKRIFYPELWTADEIAQWGKGWVEAEIFGFRA
ncbi:MAG TPA: tryptophan 2,3-dioxygenase family protein [Bacteroidia bacterium]|nr:tryptophan 2,3-dioxygenase family protein [Bacteroidia bacterium]HNT80784.1 tryptophan 2,3-dioxygenase family protein [Bacteroidia bacterium]